ncbi:MAG TPA: FadR/GntR family transcriptional regulator [Gemmatimonadaceae bacterium]|nr:FadR/GntR family transcriptional regulator [Gemmatimonadaceae bacterium]
MDQLLTPVLRQSLSDDLAQRIRKLIQSRQYKAGDRLPAISAMARDFGVGAPTLREALKKLETVGVVDIRHGSGVYVGRDPDSIVITNPVFDGVVSKKILLDLIEARIPLETTTARLAAEHGTEEHFAEMGRLLAQAEANIQDDATLNQVNLAFHRQIAVASGNVVLRQLLDVLTSVFRAEQRLILGIYRAREADHREHVAICEVLRARDAERAVELMRAHLEGVRRRIEQWDGADVPAA